MSNDKKENKSMFTAKLNQRGAIHWSIIAPVVAIVFVAVVGYRTLTGSHAATTATSTTEATLNTNTAILGPKDTPSGTQSAQSSVPYSFIGYQTVNYLSPGQALTYNQGIKGNVKSCFDIYVTQPKSGTVTATVEFANNNNYVTKTLSSNLSNNLQQVCVAPGSFSNPGFNVKNLTPLQQNTNIEVLQDILTW